MRRVSLREFNQHLGQHIAAVEAGETIELTRRGRPIARIQPVSTSAAERRDDPAYKALIELLERGLPTSGPTPRWTRDEIYERGE